MVEILQTDIIEVEKKDLEKVLEYLQNFDIETASELLKKIIS